MIVIKTDKGIVIEADTFIYNKIKNIVDADGNIKIVDQIIKYKIYSDQAAYNRNKEEITARLETQRLLMKR